MSDYPSVHFTSGGVEITSGTIERLKIEQVITVTSNNTTISSDTLTIGDVTITSSQVQQLLSLLS